MTYSRVRLSDCESNDVTDHDSDNEPSPNSTNFRTKLIKVPITKYQINTESVDNYGTRVMNKLKYLASIELCRFECRNIQRDDSNQRHFNKVLIISVLILIYYFFCKDLNTEHHPQTIVNVPPINRNLSGPKVPNGFLVWSPSCRIPALDPYAEDVMKLFQRENFQNCSSTEPITRIEINLTTTEAILFHDSSKWYSSFVKAKCCYSEITRSGSGEKVDSEYKLSSCEEFSGSVKLPMEIEYILVECKLLGIPIYKNTHAIIREKPDIRRRLNEFKNKPTKKEPLSVLMLSIDSVSRLNLIRAMPKTAQHLYDNGWFELQGYNKVDDNTFPNLMAILTGYNDSLTFDECNPHVVGKLDECPFIWNDFKKSGYVTSYGEDEASMSSFTVQKVGFLNTPTDYYLRPYMLAAEKHLTIKCKHKLTFCLGYKHSVDHVYDYAMDFATQYKNDASFGLFWTNTFSHNELSDPSAMDRKMRSYLDVLETRGILNDSIIVFFSDHGLRFGPVLHLVTGWLEERLPFIFIWLPEWFRNEYPEIVHALKINRNRLTTPYDLHMTLKHILQLSKPGFQLKPAASCPKCQSLFTEVPWNRSCEDAAIEPHWCTCNAYKEHDKNDEIIKNAVDYAIEEMNRDLRNHIQNGSEHPLCAELKMKEIFSSRKAEYREGNSSYDDYIIVFEVAPSSGWFESTIRHRPNGNQFEITGSVSRLDSYAGQSDCIEIDRLRKYCFCLGSN